jgi:peptidoglycan hydrolase-like protein with peptidoglycan-binding domain
VALAVIGVGAAAAGIGGRSVDPPARGAAPPATAPVTRQTLTETQTVAGTLGYGDARDLPGRAAGTLTWVPAAGQRIGRGQPAYRVDDRPVTLLYGPLPMYRALGPDSKGPDVRQFETNLWALGYRGFTVDDRYGAGTARAVRSWQRALGRPVTGTVDPATVVTAPGALRVAELKAQVGDQVGGSVLAYTGPTQVIGVDLEVKYQSMVRRGATVGIDLPGGGSATGTVADVGTVASTAQKDGETKATVKVTVTVADPRRLGGYDRAPVELRLTAAERTDVLTVPVAALLALAEGGYGVEVVEGGRSRTVPVRLGMFAGGRVEVSGDGLRVGTVVGVPT